MFTCTNPEDFLFPSDAESNQHHQQLQLQRFTNLQRRCLKLEGDCQQYQHVLQNLQNDSERNIQNFLKEKEREFHQLGTVHAMNLQDLENKYLRQLQNRTDDIIQYQINLQEKSQHIITLTNEIEVLQEQNQETEKIYLQKIETLNQTIQQLQTSQQIEMENSLKLSQENHLLVLSISTHQQEKDDLISHINELLSSKDAILNCIQKLTQENLRLKQKYNLVSSPHPSCSSIASHSCSNPATPQSTNEN